MHKQYYTSIFKWFGKAFMFKLVQLAKLLPFLDRVNSKKTLDSLMYYFKEERHYKGHIITKYYQKLFIWDGGLSDSLYFMAEG